MTSRQRHAAAPAPRISSAVVIPSFLLGLTAAVAAEMSVGLLLYASTGLVPSLTLILTVVLGSLCVGLWTGRDLEERVLVDGLRRRWLFALIAFFLAAFVAGAWSVLGGLADERVTRGLGLAFLAALPLYGCGALLGGVAASRSARTARREAGVPALAGATVGALLTGLLLVDWMIPASVYVLCVFLISVGALIHGQVLRPPAERRVLAARDSAFGDVVVEEVVFPPPDAGYRRTLKENGRERGVEDESGRPSRAWEVACLDLLRELLGPQADPPSPRAFGEAPVADAAADAVQDPSRLLIVGGGSFTLARLALREWRTLRVDVVERNPVVVSAAGDLFNAPLESERVRVRTGEPRGALSRLDGPYRAILLDAAELAPCDPVPQLDERAWASLADGIDDDGIVIFGGLRTEVLEGVPLGSLLDAAGGHFQGIHIHAPSAEAAPGGVRPGSTSESGEVAERDSGGLLIVLARGPASSPLRVDGWELEAWPRAHDVEPRAGDAPEAPGDESTVAAPA